MTTNVHAFCKCSGYSSISVYMINQEYFESPKRAKRALSWRLLIQFLSFKNIVTKKKDFPDFRDSQHQIEVSVEERLLETCYVDGDNVQPNSLLKINLPGEACLTPFGHKKEGVKRTLQAECIDITRTKWLVTKKTQAKQ